MGINLGDTNGNSIRIIDHVGKKGLSQIGSHHKLLALRALSLPSRVLQSPAEKRHYSRRVGIAEASPVPASLPAKGLNRPLISVKVFTDLKILWRLSGFLAFKHT